MHDKAIRSLVQGLVASLLPAGAAFAGPVNLNSADAATLARELDGIGPAKAQAIVDFRQNKVLEQNRGNIRVGGSAAAPAPAGKAGQKTTSKSSQPPAGDR
jgi:competence protein ComEA